MFRKPNLFVFHPQNVNSNFAVTASFTDFGWYYLYPPSQSTLVSPRLIYIDSVSLPKYIGYSTNLPIGCFASTYQPVGLCQISYIVAAPLKLKFTHEQEPTSVSIDHGIYTGRLVASSLGTSAAKPSELTNHTSNQTYLTATENPALLLLDDYSCLASYVLPADLAAMAAIPGKVAYGKFSQHQRPITSIVPTGYFGLPIKGNWQELGRFIDTPAIPTVTTVVNPVTNLEPQAELQGDFTAIAIGLILQLAGLTKGQLVAIQLPSLFGNIPSISGGSLDSFDFSGMVTFEANASEVNLDFTSSVLLSGTLSGTICQQGNSQITVL
jgi:hypothetical protein